MSDRKVPKIRFPGFTDDWEQRKFYNISEKLCVGFVGTCEKYYTDKTHGIPMYRTGNIKDGFLVEDEMKYITREFHEKNKKSQLKKNDILIARFGENGLGAQYLKDEEANCLNCIILHVNKEMNSEYVKQYLSSDAFRKEAFSNTVGSTFSILNTTTLGKMAIPYTSLSEQNIIARFLLSLDNLITLHQRECDKWKELKKGMLQKMFPQEGKSVPEIRFPGFTDPWEQRMLGNEFERINERNNGQFGITHWISVAKMYYQEPDKVQSNNLDTRTYVMREGDIAFEGHPNSEFQFGRFVANDIGDGIISELFPIYRHKMPYFNSYWKYAIQIERIMRPIYAKAITSSGASSNKLNEEHFLRENILVPSLKEQEAIGTFLTNIDNLITLHQRECDKWKELKKGLLQQMFV